MALRPPVLAVTVTEPAARALTSPADETVATAELLVVHWIWRPVTGLPRKSFSTAEYCWVAPTGIEAAEGVSVTETTTLQRLTSVAEDVMLAVESKAGTSLPGALGETGRTAPSSECAHAVNARRIASD